MSQSVNIKSTKVVTFHLRCSGISAVVQEESILLEQHDC